MNHSALNTIPLTNTQRPLRLALITAGLLAFVALFVLVDGAYYNFANARFPNVGASGSLATLWGVVSRAHILVFILPLAIWQPRRFGFQPGSIRRHWQMLLWMLLGNCGVIAAYLWLTHSSTPYSANQWLVTEVLSVPLVEEMCWRGIVFTLLLEQLRKIFAEAQANHWAVWLSGLAFGLLHANNLAAGVPPAFVAIQVLNATIWGVVYGCARARTGSIYPSIVLHAAMNLVVIAF